MKLLLDTHIWVWSFLEQDKLAPDVKKGLTDNANQLYLSPLSLCELLFLCMKGRIQLPHEPLIWVAEALSKTPVTEAQVSNDVALETARFQLPHRDPCDQLLVATARVLGLTLVTADERLIRAKQCPVLPNR